MFRNWSIKTKLIGGVLLTSVTVLVLTCGVFLAYELVTFRQSMVANLSTLARVIAGNSTAALAFENRDDATTVLSALSAERHVVAATLYDKDGELFATYLAPGATAPAASLPPRPADGYQFTNDRLMLHQPVVNANRRLGALVLQSDLGTLSERLMLYRLLIVAVLTLSSLVAFALSSRLQRHISRPILALVNSAGAVADRHDYSTRAEKFSDDELGRLTDAFNEMLGKIEEQTEELRARQKLLTHEVAERARAEAAVQALNLSLEDRVKDRTQALEAANKELEAFSYSVSHDLRAPLRSVAGFSRILMDDYLADLPGEAADYLQRVHKGAERMGQLVDDLLAFARLGRAPVKRVRIDPTATVQQVIDELMDDRKDREVEIVLDPLPPCDADAALLKQVYVNLVSNALKFTRDKNDARIEIGAQASDADTTPVYFVKDNGAGFDMQYANKLFGVFQRLHRNDEFEGTGVGLAIVQRVITRHGGRVWAESAPQKGARFFFTIGGLG